MVGSRRKAATGTGLSLGDVVSNVLGKVRKRSLQAQRKVTARFEMNAKQHSTARCSTASHSATQQHNTRAAEQRTYSTTQQKNRHSTTEQNNTPPRHTHREHNTAAQHTYSTTQQQNSSSSSSNNNYNNNNSNNNKTHTKTAKQNLFVACV